MTGLPAACAAFALDALAPQPWKNGAGVTRELATCPAEAGGQDFDWRVSVADIDADGPFSRFDGIDRQIMLLSGAGVRLAAQDGSFDHVLDAPYRPFAFAGETPVQATLLGGATRDLNVMTRRGRYRAEITTFNGGFGDIASADHDAVDMSAGARAWIVLAAAGAWRVRVGRGAAIELPAGSGLVVRKDHDPFPRGEHTLRGEASGSTPPALCIRIAIHAEDAP